MNKNFGLTLLELMIVVAIVGILATLAIPSYQHYASKAKFSEVIQAVAPYKLAVGLCLQEHQDLVSCSKPGEQGIPADFSAPDSKTGYVASVSVGENAVITAVSQGIKIKNKEGFSYTLQPELQHQITWKKGGTCLQERLC